MTRIFINYRRADSAGHVGRLYDHLSAHVGARNIFIDLDSIPAGADFIAAIETAVATSDALLAVIGPHWLTVHDAAGQRRIDNPADFVRLEIATALARDSLVIPVLVGDATMPAEHELPDMLAPLARRNAIELSDSRWLFDVGRLITLLEKAAGVQGTGAAAGPALGATNLPAQLTPLVGRDRDIARVRARLEQPDIRLLTLTGPGGIGKSALALAAAEQLRSTFPDGVWLVSLAAINDPQLVSAQIADVLGLKEVAGQSISATLKIALRESRALLLIENFERVLSVAPLLNELLQAAPYLEILVTSRAVLHLSGEHEYPVAPLELPELHRTVLLDDLAHYGAVDLFVRRARAVKPEFELTAAAAPAVVECCRRLDGLPLAIELAAARCRLLPPQVILQRLEQRLKLLTGGARDLPARQQTLRGAIDWSYDLLEPQEQQLFACLAIFSGSFTIEAAEAVCNRDGELAIDMMDGLQSLLDKSLLGQNDSSLHTTDPRFAMLQTIREYALERLMGTGDHDLLRQSHATYFLELSEQAAPALTGQHQEAWLQRLTVDHDNLRAALEWTLRPEAGTVEVALRLGGALWRFWETRGHLTEGRAWLMRALDQARNHGWSDLSAAVRARALNGAGNLAWTQGDYLAARALHEESLALSRQAGDRLGIATSLGNLGIVVLAQGDSSAARALYDESLALCRELGDTRGIATALNGLAGLAVDEGTHAEARRLYEESLAHLRALADPRGVAYALGNLGILALHQGDSSAARALYDESLALRRELGDTRGIATVLNNLGVLALHEGNLDTARALYDESLMLRRELGDREGLATSLANLAQIALEQGDHAAARALFVESLSLNRELSDREGLAVCLEGLINVATAQNLPERVTRIGGALAALADVHEEILQVIDAAHLQQSINSVRAELGENAWSAAWAAGRALTLEQAVDDALNGQH